MRRTFGTITMARKRWVVDCEPHVRQRLRKIFLKVGNSKGRVTLPANPENAYELQWVMERYPMDVDPKFAESFGNQVAQFKERRTAIERILYDSAYTPPLFGLALPPREYQRQAADLLLQSGGLLLADDLGIGKTVSALCTLADDGRRTLPALVVTMTHLPKQWKAEVNRFLPGLAVQILKKGTPYDLCQGRRGKRHPFPDVIISNYHKLAGWSEALAGKVNSVIFDEVQELRHDGSHKYKAAKEIADAAPFRMGLSATPVYNYGGEIYNIVEVLQPGALGNKGEFVGEWCSYGGDKPRVSEPDALGTYLREQGIMLRRTRADVGRELPPLSKVEHHIDADLGKLAELSKSVAELARTILSQQGVSTLDRMQASSELDWRLRQATGIAKAPYVADFVRMLVDSGEQVVLYGWHHEVYAIWRERLADLNPAFYTGKESLAQKEEAKRAFLAGEAKVLVMSLRAGAGLDGLQGKARTVVFGELDWSPGVHDQGIGRLHRDGQLEAVIAYFLVAEDGSDPVIADILGIKRQQAEGIRDPNRPLFETAVDNSDRIRRLASEFLARHGGKKNAA